MATQVAEVKLTDNTNLIVQATTEAIYRALEAVGTQVESQSKIELESDPRRVDQGTLRNSISHTRKGYTVIIGSNLSYAKYVHEGTGKYNSGGSTGDKYWVYVIGGNQPTSNTASGKRYTYDEARKVVAILRSKGLNAHMTQGMKPNRFLRNAIMNNIAQLKQLTEDKLRGH